MHTKFSNMGRASITIALAFILALFQTMVTLPETAQADELKGAKFSTQTAKALKINNAKKKPIKKTKKTSIKRASASKIKDRAYTGKEIRPTVELTYKNKKLKKGLDYTLTYWSNTNSGTAQIIIKGIGRYKGKKIITFNIVKTNLSKVTISKVKDRAYTGKEIKPAVKLTYKNKKLEKEIDYTLTYQSNKQRGTAQIIIMGIGRYKGKKVIEFNIVKAQISKAKVTEIGSLYTTGLSSVKPKPVVVYSGQTLKASRDYKVTYQNNINPGTATAIIEGKGNFTGSVTTTFKLVNMGDKLARKACSLSYSQEKWKTDGYNGTQAYVDAYNKYKVKSSGPLASCSTGMHIAIRAANYDSTFTLSTSQDSEYLNFYSELPGNSKWTYLGDDQQDIKLMPGDVLLWDVRKGYYHISMYVGSKIPKKIYNSKLKNTDADYGEPSNEWVSAHAGYGNGSALCICDWKNASSGGCKHYKVFRCTNPDFLNTKK